MFWWIAACAPSDPDAGVERLVRASMALRGTRPTLAELRAVAEDPDAADVIVDGYVEGDAFGATVRDLHAVDLQLRNEYGGWPAAGALAGFDALVVSRALYEEPLRLVEHVVRDGRPYTDIVTTDEVVVDTVVAAAWGLQGPENADGLVVTTWGDGRPAAGILASSGLWLRIGSNGENQNRGRANRMARALVCQDFLVSDIPLDEGAFADARDATDALRTAPECTSCHDALDPIASAFYAFSGFPTSGELREGCEDGSVCYPIAGWREAAVGDWAAHDMPAPGWFGEPVDDLAHLGRLVAADPRFATCAARRFSGWMRHVAPAEVGAEEADLLAGTFVASGYDARVLARAAVDTDTFRDAGPLPIRPDQLARLVADLTGYTWEDAAGVDLLTSDREGWRVLAGGTDGQYVPRPDEAVTPTKALVAARLAERAARHVVAADLDEPDRAARRLLTEVDEEDTDADVVRAQLATLHLRVLGERVSADSLEVGETWDLFADVQFRRGSTREAWIVVIAAMLQDGRVLWY